MSSVCMCTAGRLHELGLHIIILVECRALWGKPIQARHIINLVYFRSYSPDLWSHWWTGKSSCPLCCSAVALIAVAIDRVFSAVLNSPNTRAFGLQESVFTIWRTNRQTDTLTSYTSITGACDCVLRIPHCSRFLLPSCPPGPFHGFVVVAKCKRVISC